MYCPGMDKPTGRESGPTMKIKIEIVNTVLPGREYVTYNGWTIDDVA